MRILKNVTKQELGFYTNQLTAKAMHERTMRNSVYVLKDDAGAAAVFVASRKAEKIPNQTDKVELSSAGQKISPNSTKCGRMTFRMSAVLAVKQGKLPRS